MDLDWSCGCAAVSVVALGLRWGYGEARFGAGLGLALPPRAHLPLFDFAMDERDGVAQQVIL